jgi:hypothetical protein
LLPLPCHRKIHPYLLRLAQDTEMLSPIEDDDGAVKKVQTAHLHKEHQNISHFSIQNLLRSI